VHKTPALLKRWIAATGGNVPYPSSPQAISLEIGLQLQQADPELFAVVSGADIPASLELAVMDGSLPDVAIPQADREAQARRAEAERLIAEGAFPTAGRYEGETYIPGREGSVTAQFAVEELAPDLAERERLRVAAEQASTPGGMTAEDIAFVHAEMARNRTESLQRAAQSMQGVI
jgi:hypothetical protein